MPLSRSAQFQHLADLALEELELLEAPAARLSGNARSIDADRIRTLRRQAALWRATAAALDPHAHDVEFDDGVDKPVHQRKGARLQSRHQH